jgi:IS30 family transposase
LTLDERTVIADLRREPWTLRDIGDELGRSPSTIRRELRRNLDDRGRYLLGVSQKYTSVPVPAVTDWCQAKPRKISITSRLLLTERSGQRCFDPFCRDTHFGVLSFPR